MNADFLLIAGSARFLAESAQESGYRCVAVDGFGDADLVVLDQRQASLRDDGFDAEELSLRCDELLDRYAPTGAVVGPGIDNQADFLGRLQGRTEFFGNAPAVFSQCADARCMRDLFRQLEIPHPAATALHLASADPHPAPAALHPASADPHPAPAVPHHAPAALHPAPAVPHHAPAVPHHAPTALHPAPAALHPAPAAPHPAPAVPHPASVASKWLRKSSGACGGGHIRWAGDDDIDAESYLPGTAVSHLFLADGRHTVTVGFNTQWHSAHDEGKPFCYGGAVNRCSLSVAEQARLEHYAARLTRELGLVGLNAMDYIKTPHNLYCLEVNPRPSATMQLYAELKLFEAHLQACRGNLRPLVSSVAPPCAHAVVYAADELRLGGTLDWPDGVCDVPAVNVGAMVFKSGNPICSVRFSGRTVAETLTQLNRKIISLSNRIKPSLVLAEAV